MSSSIDPKRARRPFFCADKKLAARHLDLSIRALLGSYQSRVLVTIRDPQVIEWKPSR